MAEHQFGRWVKLNVGGTIYRTTRSTLLKDPNSMLSAMFSGRHELEKDEDGAYSIDRDGELFRYVLSYLRNGQLFCPEEKWFRKELLAEARFYQLGGMIAALTYSMESVTLKGNDDLLPAVISWLPYGVSEFSLLFRASTDGYSSASFHDYCDNKGPTIVVAKGERYIVGGFTTHSWTSPQNVLCKYDKDAFLFILVDESAPQKISHSPTLKDGGILCDRNSGPSFGLKYYEQQPNRKIICYHNDLRFLGQGNRFVGSFYLGGAFECPPNMRRLRNYFGGYHPSFDELEVFEVKF